MPEQFYGTGRRKTSAARVFLRPAKNGGQITVNKMGLDEYFERESAKLILRQPLEIIEKELGVPVTTMFNIYVTVKGGGKSGQAGAVRLGISRALYQWAAIEYGAVYTFQDNVSSQIANILTKMEKHGTGFSPILLRDEEELSEQFVTFRKTFASKWLLDS